MTEDVQEEDYETTLNETFQEKYGRPIPDMVVGITPDGFANALSAQLTKDKLIPEQHYVTGVITNIDFGPEEYLPIGLYLEKIPDKVN